MRWDPSQVAPLPDTKRGAEIAFYVVLFTFAALEQRVRLRSWRTGGRADRAPNPGCRHARSLLDHRGEHYRRFARPRARLIPGGW